MPFQLDQCLDSKRFVRDCAAEGRDQPLRLPSDLRDAEDPQLLRSLMANQNPLVTFDRALPHLHTAFIPGGHPGIIILSNYPQPQTMTIRIAQRLLSRLKSAFSAWDRVSWANSVVEFTTIGAEVWHVDQGRLARDAYLAFDAEDWPGQLSNVLSQNAQLGRQPQ
jgi:hypothetical protein